MTFLLMAIGVLLIGGAVRSLIHAAVLPRTELSLHLRSIGIYGFGTDETAAGDDARGRLNEVVARRAEQLGRLLIARLPALTPLSRGEIAAAGMYDMTPETVHGYRVLGALALPSLILFYIAAAGGFSILMLVVLVLAAVAGWFLPALFIRSRGNSRLLEVDRELPDLIDLLTATVEAGMGVPGSISLVANRFKGALGDELRLTVQQGALGVSSATALGDMAERCDTPSVRAFVRTVTRGESLGVSIGPILRELATDVRRRRRQALKERMQKAPVKMLFPLMLLIFPALMIELLFPAGYGLLHALSAGG
jgi:tight adherence protein C